MKESKAQVWGLITPTLFLMIFIGVIPVIYILYLSVFRYSVFARTPFTYIGFDNFRKLVFDESFLRPLTLSLSFVAISCGIQLPLGMFIANLLTQNFRGKGIFRTIMSLPLAMAPISIGSIWTLLTNPDIGPLTYLFNRLGIIYNIGENAFQAYSTIVVMDAWHWTPFVTLTLMAGLTALPNQPYEAALVDGAGRWQTFWYVTIPLLKPVILTTMFIRIMDALRIFDEVWFLTGGGPGTATRFASLHLVRLALRSRDYGYSSAMSLFLLYLTIIICWLLLTFITTSREER